MSAVAVAGVGDSATIADGPRMPLWPIATPPEKVMSAMTGMTTTHSQRPQPPDDGTAVVPEPRLETGAAGTAKPGPSRAAAAGRRRRTRTADGGIGAGRGWRGRDEGQGRVAGGGRIGRRGAVGGVGHGVFRAVGHAVSQCRLASSMTPPASGRVVDR